MDQEVKQEPVVQSQGDTVPSDKLPEETANAVAPGMRRVFIDVPNNIDDNTVRAAWESGVGVVQALMRGHGLFVFPHVQKGADGKPVPSIGSFPVLLRQPKDIENTVEYIRHLNMINVKAAQASASGKPSDTIAANLQSKGQKEVLLEQAKDQAEGKSKIILET